MKRNLILILTFLTSIFLTSCIEDFVIDTPEGMQLVGINGYFTNEYKKHQIVISRTTDFYSEEDPEMISGAEVYIHDGTDTIHFKETDVKGYYETIDSVAGVIGKTYNLCVNIVDEEGLHSYYAQSTMRENTPQIDSMAINDVSLSIMPNISITSRGLCPYFQGVDDIETSYLFNIAINDTLIYNVFNDVMSNSLLNCKVLSLQGLSGMYFNGEDMVNSIGMQNVYTFETITNQFYPETGESYEMYTMNGPPYAEEGDVIKLYIYSISPEFNKYITDINSSFGSNPMMGMPYNVSTNIYPGGKAAGFFEAASVVTGTMIY